MIELKLNPNGSWVCRSNMLVTIDKTPEAALFANLVGTGQVLLIQRPPTSEDYLANPKLPELEGAYSVVMKDLDKDYPADHLSWLLGQAQDIELQWNRMAPDLKLETKDVA